VVAEDVRGDGEVTEEVDGVHAQDGEPAELVEGRDAGGGDGIDGGHGAKGKAVRA
jgi:hypothetical protein